MYIKRHQGRLQGWKSPLVIKRMKQAQMQYRRPSVLIQHNPSAAVLDAVFIPFCPTVRPTQDAHPIRPQRMQLPGAGTNVYKFHIGITGHQEMTDQHFHEFFAPLPQVGVVCNRSRMGCWSCSDDTFIDQQRHRRCRFRRSDGHSEIQSDWPCSLCAPLSRNPSATRTNAPHPPRAINPLPLPLSPLAKVFCSVVDRGQRRSCMRHFPRRHQPTKIIFHFWVPIERNVQARALKRAAPGVVNPGSTKDQSAPKPARPGDQEDRPEESPSRPKSHISSFQFGQSPYIAKQGRVHTDEQPARPVTTCPGLAFTCRIGRLGQDMPQDALRHVTPLHWFR